MTMKLTAKQKLQIAKNVAVEIPLEILQFLVVPIALLFAKESDDHLPRMETGAFPSAQEPHLFRSSLLVTAK